MPPANASEHDSRQRHQILQGFGCQNRGAMAGPVESKIENLQTIPDFGTRNASIFLTVGSDAWTQVYWYV